MGEGLGFGLGFACSCEVRIRLNQPITQKRSAEVGRTSCMTSSDRKTCLGLGLGLGSGSGLGSGLGLGLGLGLGGLREGLPLHREQL